MAYCANCGNPLNEGQRFCPACGQPVAATPAEPVEPPAAVAQTAQYAPPPPPPPQSPAPPPPPAGGGYQQGWNYYPQAEQQPEPPRRGHTGLWIGLGALVVAIAVACGLVFGVFKDDIFGGGGGASSPEQAVKKLLAAYEDQDIDAVFGLIDPQSMSALLDGESEEAVKDELRDLLAEEGSVRFSDIKLKIDETSDATATVTITGGTVTVTDADGKETSSDVTEEESPPTFDLVKRDGSWYIDAESTGLVDEGTDGGGEEPVTTSTSVGGGSATTVASGSTTTTGSGASSTVTSTTLFTTTSMAAGGGSGASTPEEVVLKLFDAMENKDLAAMFALFDPVAVEEVTGGASLEEFMTAMGDSMFDFESVEFSGIELDVEYLTDTTASVTVTSGSVTMTDSDGYTSTEDVTESDEPVAMEVVKRDGSWYIDPNAMF